MLVVRDRFDAVRDRDPAWTALVGIVELKSRDWQAEWINMIGCVAFVGALCFLVAALAVLPRDTGTKPVGEH